MKKYQDPFADDSDDITELENDNKSKSTLTFNTRLLESDDSVQEPEQDLGVSVISSDPYSEDNLFDTDSTAKQQNANPSMVIRNNWFQKYPKSHKTYSIDNDFNYEFDILDPAKRSGRLAKKYEKPFVGNKRSLLSRFTAFLSTKRKRYAKELNGPRYILVNDVNGGSQGGLSNSVSTSKYNLVTFIPKFLFEQFSKYYNIFFLFISCIQQIPGVSPTSRFTTIGPLVLVLIVSACKEFVEDFKRHQQDKELNRSETRILQQSQFTKAQWNQISVGDIIRVENEQAIPADIVLLASSEPEGLCYIETSNLDGETNLKVKQALPETSILMDPNDLAQFTALILSEQPNNDLYNFDATMYTEPIDLQKKSKSGKLINVEDPFMESYENQYQNHRDLRTLENDENAKALPLSTNQLLLRGARLRNTPWVIGVVVFIGHETKLMRNATAAPIKRTAVEKMVNLQIIFLVSLLVSLSVISTIGSMIISTQHSNYFTMINIPRNFSLNRILMNLLTFCVLYSNLVPISLFVTVEMVKFMQAQLISNDLDMYYSATETAVNCRTSNLVEELGQVEYIFTDKTGTLTCNIMRFQQCSIAGQIYAETVPENKKPRFQGDLQGQLSFEDLKADSSNPLQDEFLKMLALCHTVIPEKKDNGEIKYQASSPDEGALVQSAALLGYQFQARTPKSVLIKVKGKEYNYELLNVCEFNSNRKRMSIIYKCPDGLIRIYCKGADSVVLDRLSEKNHDLVATTLEHLEEFATEGLRTLCLAYRVISVEEYESWSKVFQKASTVLVRRAEQLDDAAELIEKDFLLLGASAVEDKLQDGVSDAIHTLQTAGIKMWMLTGDRQETAINIGMSCKLLSDDMNIIVINETTNKAVSGSINQKISALKNLGDESMTKELLALVIDGNALNHALEANLALNFLDLAERCKTVICCRVSPLQKALVVKLVKNYRKSLLLAIGDGANDVGMIQAAHVGVGIQGLEGVQAARSADISFAQFRFLRKLLLVHGSWSYQRLSKLILFSFYKNIALYMTQFWYAFANGFSGQVIFESWTITYYNVFFTVMPPVVIGLFDQYVNAVLLEKYPQLYKLGQKGVFFNVKSFWFWIINGFYHSILLIIFPVLIIGINDFEKSGLVSGHWVWGTTIYTSVLATVLGKASLITTVWTKYTYIAIPGSFLLWMVFLPIYSLVVPSIGISSEYRGILSHIYGNPLFWATVLLMPLICLSRDFSWKYAKRMYYPEPYHYIQEIQKLHVADYRPRAEQFQKAIRKVRQVQRMRKQRGYAFSQAEEGQTRMIRAYDTTQNRGKYGELR